MTDIKPNKNQITFTLVSRQDGLIKVPDTMKKRSSASMVLSVNGHTELMPNDVILHNQKFLDRIEDFHGTYFMPISDVYAKIIGGNICPIDEWILCRLHPPKTEVFDPSAIRKTNIVEVCAVSLSNSCDGIRLGQKYLIAGWDQEIVQMQFGHDKSFHAFMKVKHLIAEYHE